MLIRLLAGGLAAALLSDCTFSSRSAADEPARHYHGVVTDAKTGAPVPYVSVTAYHLPLSLHYVLPPDYLGFTLSRKDGSFDLEIPAERKKANHLEATADTPLADPAHPRQEKFSGYSGQLNHVSDRRANLVLVRRNGVR